LTVRKSGFQVVDDLLASTSTADGADDLQIQVQGEANLTNVSFLIILEIKWYGKLSIISLIFLT